MEAPEAYPQGYVVYAFAATGRRDALRRRLGTTLTSFLSIRLDGDVARTIIRRP
jgi:hypothetical protein